MKHWQFYLAILVLIFLLLPIYESFGEKLAPIQKGLTKLETELIPNMNDQIQNINTSSANSDVQAAESDTLLRNIQAKYPGLKNRIGLLETQYDQSDKMMSDVRSGFMKVNVELLPEINDNENISDNSLTTFEYSLLPNINDNITLDEYRTSGNENKFVNIESRASMIEKKIKDLDKQNNFIEDVTDFFKHHDINPSIKN